MRYLDNTYVCRQLFYPNLAHYLEVLNLFENLLICTPVEVNCELYEDVGYGKHDA